MKPMDDRQLQRLVDGELNQDEVRQILRDATESPAHWQRIALGFVEDQTWDRAFNGRLEDRSDSLEFRQSGANENEIPRPPGMKASTPGVSRLNSRLVLAASVLFAAAIGYMVSQVQNRNLPKSLAYDDNPATQTPRLAQGSVEPARPSHPSEGRPQMTQADYHLELPEEQMGEMASAGPVAPVPLFSVSNAEQWKRINEQRRQPAISTEMLKQLTGSGYRMEQDINYISGRLVDGRSFVVPVRTIRFSPGQ